LHACVCRNVCGSVYQANLYNLWEQLQNSLFFLCQAIFLSLKWFALHLPLLMQCYIFKSCCHPNPLDSAFVISLIPDIPSPTQHSYQRIRSCLRPVHVGPAALLCSLRSCWKTDCTKERRETEMKKKENKRHRQAETRSNGHGISFCKSLQSNWQLSKVVWWHRLHKITVKSSNGGAWCLRWVWVMYRALLCDLTKTASGSWSVHGEVNLDELRLDLLLQHSFICVMMEMYFD